MTEVNAVGKMQVVGNSSAAVVASGLRMHRPASTDWHLAESCRCQGSPGGAEMPRLIIYANGRLPEC